MDETIDLNDTEPMLLANQTNATSTTATTATSQASYDPNASIWQIEYYQRYFDITSSEVVTRIIKTFSFPVKNNFLSHVRENGGADIWAPFWIVTTLIVLLVISSNIGGLFNWSQMVNDFKNQMNPVVNGTHVGKLEIPDKDFEGWVNDFSIISMGAITCYTYLILVPIVLFFVMKWKKIENITLVECWSIYGYSFVIVLPCAVLCIFNSSWIRWLVIIVGFTYSTAFLISNYFQLWKDGLMTSNGIGSKPPADATMFLFIFTCSVAVLHLGFALFVKFYFFTFSTTVKLIK
jgi:hypothetical protein